MPHKSNTLLISQITQAFKDVALEDGIGLSEATAIDDYKDEQFRNACRQNDEKHNWITISSDSLNHNYTSLSFFDAKGMRFHLPAFMICEIKGEYRFGMAFALTHLSDYTKTQFALLTTKQREVIKLFLEYLANDPNYEFEKPTIEAAIKSYWDN